MTPLETIKLFYDAVARGDVAGVLALLHPELAWTEARGFPYFSGTWRTPQEVVDKLLVPLARDWNDFAATPHDFIELTASQFVLPNLEVGIREVLADVVASRRQLKIT